VRFLFSYKIFSPRAIDKGFFICYISTIISSANSYFDKFQEYYSGSGAYQEPGVDDFNYNWKVILDLFGIKYK
jgi:hypothetical protein